jgi:iron complex transport system substrate-binding protein
VILTQTHCEVCAVTPGAVGADALCRKQVVALQAGTLAGIQRGFLEVAKVIGREREAASLLASIRARMNALAAQVHGRPRPRVACLEWIEPIFHMGNWAPELVTLAGGVPVLGTPGAHSVAIPWDEVRRADPDVLLVAACGFTLERTWDEMPRLVAQPGWDELRAVRDDRVFVADGNLYFNRSSPSVFASAEILGEILHPDVVPSAHAGAWRRYARS